MTRWLLQLVKLSRPHSQEGERSRLLPCTPPPLNAKFNSRVTQCQIQLTSVLQHVHHTDRSLRRQVRGPQQERECDELEQQSSQAEIARENAQVSCCCCSCCCCCCCCSNTLLPGTKPQSCGPCHPALPLLTRRALTPRSCGLRAARYGQCLRCARIAHGFECCASARSCIAFAPLHPSTFVPFNVMLQASVQQNRSEGGFHPLAEDPAAPLHRKQVKGHIQ